MQSFALWVAGKSPAGHAVDYLVFMLKVDYKGITQGYERSDIGHRKILREGQGLGRVSHDCVVCRGDEFVRSNFDFGIG